MAIGSAIDRWFCVKSSGIKANLKFTFPLFENTTTATAGEALTAIANAGGAGWKNLNAVGSITSDYTTTVAVTNATDFANCVIILKKDFTETTFALNAAYADEIVKGEWIYSPEKNGDRFEIERSADNQNFQTIENKDGDGSGNYLFTDEMPLDAVSYYRIKYISSEVIKYSNTVEVSKETLHGLASLEISNVFPSPFTSTFTMQYNAGIAGEIKIELINEAGQLVFTDMQFCQSGFNTYLYPNQKPLPPGMYVLVVSGNKSRASKKIYKKG